jgi:hypothetical protein
VEGTIAVAKTHVVRQGEHISGIAEAEGFGDFHIIWDHANNASIKAIRDPHVLFPGDEIFIPDREEREESKPTTEVHVFEVDIPKLFLRLRVRDLDNRAVENAPCELGLVGTELVPKETDKEGMVVPEEIIPRKVRKGELLVHIQKKPAKKDDPPPPEEKMKVDLRIGSLNPEKKLSGQQARLNNLGYFAGFTLNDIEQMLWAAEEFRCDRINKSASAVTKRPKIVAISAEDQNEGEELGDPARETGIQENDLRDTLRKEHGC